jgi:hypothetical protein
VPVVTINQATFASEAGKYQVSGSTSIYANSTDIIDSHNIFLDLKKFSDDNDNATYFMIDGTINFGILVGFGEDVNLYGENGCLINLINQTDDTYGILVGSTDAGSDTYTGNMYIDDSVAANISTSREAYGVYFGSDVAGSATINGNFSVSSSGTVAYGVYFNSVVASSIAINGNFSVSSI